MYNSEEPITVQCANGMKYKDSCENDLLNKCS